MGTVKKVHLSRFIGAVTMFIVAFAILGPAMKMGVIVFSSPVRLHSAIPESLVGNRTDGDFRKRKPKNSAYFIAENDTELVVTFGEVSSLGGDWHLRNAYLELGQGRIKGDGVGQTPESSGPAPVYLSGNYQSVPLIARFKIEATTLPKYEPINAVAFISANFPESHSPGTYSAGSKWFEHRFPLIVVDPESKKGVDAYARLVGFKQGFLLKSTFLEGLICILLFGLGFTLYWMRLGPLVSVHG